jgi:hypothetical protein
MKKYILLLSLFLSILSFSSCDSDSNGDSDEVDNSSSQSEVTDETQDFNLTLAQEKNSNIQLYIDYANATDGVDITDCKQDQNCILCGFVGDTTECETPPQFPCQNTESCL